MKYCLRSLAGGLFTVLLIALDVPSTARAGAPTESIRTRIDKLYDLLVEGVSGGAPSGDRQAEARKILDEMFDWPEMAKQTLGQHWEARTAAERAEFVRLFSQLFQRTYLSRIQLADRERFAYLGEQTEGERAQVRTEVYTKQGRRIPVFYETRRADGAQWKIYDLDVDGISLVNNYRSQFTKLITRSSYGDFIEKLRALVDKRPGASNQEVVVMVGAGDIASCVSDGDEATADLLDTVDGLVFTLGDHAYEAGTPIEFAACYEESWGRHRARTRPTPGNHDYLTPGASGYFEYFGAAAGPPDKGYYAYDLGTWRVIVLNSNCAAIGGCGPGSPQERWLRRELASHPRACTLAYWHHPRFSSGPHGSDLAYVTFWQALFENSADVVLGGHDHTYERFSRQRPDGVPDPHRGIRQFVVGTGGATHHPFVGPALANSEVRNDDTFGVLKLTLHTSSYEWQFIPVAGRTFTDSGVSRCH
jgi:ABC-type transporter MlaC component